MNTMVSVSGLEVYNVDVSRLGVGGSGRVGELYF